jgi:hypothetical protein
MDPRYISSELLQKVYIHFMKYLKLRFSAIRLRSAVRSGKTMGGFFLVLDPTIRRLRG